MSSSNINTDTHTLLGIWPKTHLHLGALAMQCRQHCCGNTLKLSCQRKALNWTVMDTQWLPRLFAPMCWYPAPTLTAGLFRSHTGVAHSASRPGLRVHSLNLAWDLFFHLTAPQRAEAAETQREKDVTGCMLASKLSWMSQDLTDCRSGPRFLRCAWHQSPTLWYGYKWHFHVIRIRHLPVWL